MSKFSQLPLHNDYEVAPIFYTEAIGDSNYAFPITIKASRRTLRNSAVIQMHSALEQEDFQVFHNSGRISSDYIKYLNVMHYVRERFTRQSCRESLWKRAVENLYKRINFLQLNIEFLQEDVTAEEFEQVLSEHESEYVISFQNVKDNFEAEAIHDIVRALGVTFDVHEVSELFGVEAESLYEKYSLDTSEQFSEETQQHAVYLSSGH